MWKADIDAAYRRLPISPGHRSFAWIAFRLSETETVLAQHMAMPFGAVASVHAWDRIGALLARIARRLLKIPILRYVDDFFAPERAGTANFAMQCFARLVKVHKGCD